MFRSATHDDCASTPGTRRNSWLHQRFSYAPPAVFSQMQNQTIDGYWRTCAMAQAMFTQHAAAIQQQKISLQTPSPSTSQLQQPCQTVTEKPGPQQPSPTPEDPTQTFPSSSPSPQNPANQRRRRRRQAAAAAKRKLQLLSSVSDDQERDQSATRRPNPKPASAGLKAADSDGLPVSAQQERHLQQQKFLDVQQPQRDAAAATGNTHVKQVSVTVPTSLLIS